MYKQMYLVPPHVYKNIKECIKSSEEMSELAEANQNIREDYITDAFENEKKPHASKNTEIEKNKNMSMKNNQTQGDILSNMTQAADTSLKTAVENKSKKNDMRETIEAWLCQFCKRIFKTQGNLKKHYQTCRKKDKTISFAAEKSKDNNLLDSTYEEVDDDDDKMTSTPIHTRKVDEDTSIFETPTNVTVSKVKPPTFHTASTSKQMSSSLKKSAKKTPKKSSPGKEELAKSTRSSRHKKNYDDYI